MTGTRTDAENLSWAIKRCQDYLLDRQYDDGYWWAELEANATITSEYLMLTHFLDVADGERWDQIVNYLKRTQGGDGTWPIYFGGPSDLNATVEAYFALKLAGESPNEPFMAKAREFILSRGGVPKVRNFTKIWLALFGQWPWDATPVMPPEIMFLPTALPFNLYEFSSWARPTIIAMLIILNKRPVREVPEYARIDELFPADSGPLKYTVRGKPSGIGWQSFFIWLDKGLRVWERIPLKPGRGKAIKKAEQWILEHQNPDGSWAGIQPPWVYSLMALHCLGYPVDHPVMAKGLEGFRGFAISENGTFRTQSCVSPVWDTAWSVIALRESGMEADDPLLLKAGEWLLDEQITVAGDWRVKAPDLEPGGWAFQFHNDLYPDIDDAAEVLIALRLLDLPQDEKDQAMKLGADWVLGMQSRNGGWGAFDKDNTKRFVTKIPFCDFGETIDPPTEDVTAHVLEFLGMEGSKPETSQAVGRGLDYLKREQEYDGAWFGRWGVNYIYGLGAVLPALKEIGEDMGQPYIQRAVQWLRDYQQPDGGWGESCATYDDPSQRGRGPSTASQTAWALLGLMAAGETDSAAVGWGINYLLDHQGEDGTWEEDHFTGTGFPRDFLIKYHMYRTYFPLIALGRYKRLSSSNGRGG